MPRPELSTVKHDFLASIVVFLVALPLCMGIAIACGVPVAAGLLTGILGGLVVGALAGCPLQVSGPAAGLIVLVYEIVHEYGLEVLGIVVLLAGAVQVAAGLLHLGQWFRAVSPAVIKGMLAGIGVLIFASQFHVMVDDRPQGSGVKNLLTIPKAIAKSLSLDDFHNREMRQFRAQTLRDVGDLHQQQSHLHQTLHESGNAPPHLAALDAGQKEVAHRLSQLTAELSRFHEQTDSDRARRMWTAAEAAQRHSLAAAASLDEKDFATALSNQQEAVAWLETLLARSKNHSFAAILGLLTIGAILLWHAAPKSIRLVPAPLIAVVTAAALAGALSLPVLYVETPSNLWDEVHFPTWSVFSTVPWQTLVKYTLVIAVVASAETLLCAAAVDQMQNGTRTRYDRELLAQGVGNLACGFLGALPMTGVIVRSSANIQAGAKSRMSSMLHGVWLLVFVVGLAFLLQLIPTASLAAILVYTGYKLVDVKSIRELRKYGWGEVIIYAATVVTIVATDLLTGVLVGVGLAAAKLLYTFSQLKIGLKTNLESNAAVLSLQGTATFLRLPLLARYLDRVPEGAALHVDFEKLNYIDHACLDLLMTWAKRHASTGGEMSIDWDSLHASYRGKREEDRTASRPEQFDKSAA